MKHKNEEKAKKLSARDMYHIAFSEYEAGNDALARPLFLKAAKKFKDESFGIDANSTHLHIWALRGAAECTPSIEDAYPLYCSAIEVARAQKRPHDMHVNFYSIATRYARMGHVATQRGDKIAAYFIALEHFRQALRCGTAGQKEICADLIATIGAKTESLQRSKFQNENTCH